MFGSSPLGIPNPRPSLHIGGWNMATNQGFYYVLLVFAVLVTLVIEMIRRGRLGRLLEAMADSPLALETHGLSPTSLKVIVFCVSSALAALAGALSGSLYGVGLGASFPSFDSIYILVIAVIITTGGPWFAVLAAIAYSVVPSYIQGSTTTQILQLIFGVSAVFGAYTVDSPVSYARLYAILDKLGGRKPGPAAPAGAGRAASERGTRPAAMAATSGATGEGRSRSGLAVRELTVRYGGVTAVNAVNLEAPLGRITGLLGPNGAGKTSLFNACSGLFRPSAGHVVLAGRDITNSPPSMRARLGLGRTFQRTELFNNLTVAENVAMGREAALAGVNPLAQLAGSRQARRIVGEAAAEAMSITGISHLAQLQAGLLPNGQRRLVELARALAGSFDVLLLDEPSSGLDENETEDFGSVLLEVVRERGTGILLVEHDMALTRRVCDYLYVVDFGTLIFEGTVPQMEESELVRSAYLGEAVTGLGAN
jgi:ABC-type branched-subunit amino acid transport system ATPase component